MEAENKEKLMPKSHDTQNKYDVNSNVSEITSNVKYTMSQV